jgi:hypothetical protein
MDKYDEWYPPISGPTNGTPARKEGLLASIAGAFGHRQPAARPTHN